MKVPHTLLVHSAFFRHQISGFGPRREWFPVWTSFVVFFFLRKLSAMLAQEETVKSTLQAFESLEIDGPTRDIVREQMETVRE